MANKTEPMVEVLRGLMTPFNPVGNQTARPSVRTKGEPRAKPSFLNTLANLIGG